MALPDRSLGKFVLETMGDIYYKSNDIVVPKVSPSKTNVDSFETKLTNENFSAFTITDWIKYFAKKAEDGGFKYYGEGVSRNPKYRQMIKGLMGNYTASTIKALIDFLWEEEHGITDKNKMGIWILSSGWRQTIMPTFEEFMELGYVSNGRKQREWRPEKEVKIDTTKPKKKTTISIGGDD